MPAPDAAPDPAPTSVRNETELEELLTRPRPQLVAVIRTLSSPLVLLGAGGKMGPTLAVLAKRAAEAAGHPLEVIAVSRFTDPSAERWLHSRGVRTQKTDLLDRSAVQRLPDAGNLIYLVGLKFGTRQNPALTWAVNTLAPALAVERYGQARWVALSTGNVYPLVDAQGGGAREDQALTPTGEYANAAVARERIFEHMCGKYRSPLAILRLNYAVELRYGVLVDIARAVWHGDPISLANGCFNCIWQGDANDMILRAFELASVPFQAWNLTSPAVLRVRDIATRFGEIFGKPPQFTGQESNTALLSDSRRLCAILGNPPTPLEQAIRWIGEWVREGGRTFNKPTGFEVRDGRY